MHFDAKATIGDLNYKPYKLVTETQGPSNNIGRRDWDARLRFPDDRRSRDWGLEGVIERQNDSMGSSRCAYGIRPQRNNVNQGFEKKDRNDRNGH
ncbi:hypothetical protein TNCV_2668111 [Trichonephila clavipes]|nr:hypothetical protein TNCV_2668111 [Trichonephila clavipes]